MGEDGKLPRAGLALALGLAVVFLYWAVGAFHFQGYRLGVGSVQVPRPRMAYFIAFWTTFGAAATVLLTIGIGTLLEGSDRGDPFALDDSLLPPTRTLLLAAGGAALVFPVVIRALLLDGAPMTDDETAYEFMAQLIASGRLAAESPPIPLKLFFDRFQMINDGARYSQYFIGWPALLAPGIWLGIEEWMNALYAAAAVPPLFGVARHLGDRWSGAFALLLYVTSPFLMVAAATLGAHTSCLAALAWMYWAFFRTRRNPSRPLDHALFAVFFSVAFFVRPLATVGLGVPLLASWGWTRFADAADGRWRRVASFAGPAVVLAALFLGVNYVQTGSPLSVPYVEFLEYARLNDGRFTGIPTGNRSAIPNLSFAGILRGPSVVALGLLRFDASLFGWPFSLVFLLFAGADEETRLVWYSAAGYLFTRFFLKDPGIDLFGPVHFQELALPALLLSALGIRRLVRRLRAFDPEDAALALPGRAKFPVVLLACSILLAAGCYLPVRLRALYRVADNTKRPVEAVRRAGLEDAVIFSPRPFVRDCLGKHARHFLYWRTVNPPDLDSEILWVNHVSVEADRKFMEYAPGRRGFVMVWNDQCEPRFITLDSRGAERLRDGRIGGSGEGPDWSKAPDPSDYSLPPPPD